MASLRDDPHMVLEANPVVGNLLFPGSMDRDPNHPTKRFEARKLFGDLYLQRAKLLAEVMTQMIAQDQAQKHLGFVLKDGKYTSGIDTIAYAISRNIFRCISTRNLYMIYNMNIAGWRHGLD